VPRLEIMNPSSLGDRLKQAAVSSAFGFFPEGMSFMFVETALDVDAYTANISRWLRTSEDWSKGEVELMASFVSSRNHCVF